MNDRLLTPLRAAARDLVDKRLWPVALLLLVALVAVPVVIGSSASDAPAPAPIVAAAKSAPAAPKAAITVADTAVVGHSRPGAVSDPFFDPPAPDTGSASGGASTATAAGSTGATPSQGATPSKSTTTTTTTPATPATSTPPPTTTTPATPADARAERTVFGTRLSFGEPDAAVSGVSRLEALGGDTNPALLYLGTTGGGGYAAFLLGPNALSQGDAECAETTCRVIAMKEGDTQVVGVRDEDGTARQYTLKIDEITRRVTHTVAAADKLRAREDADGRDVLRAMILDKPTAAAIGRFAYDRATGAVVSRSAS